MYVTATPAWTVEQSPTQLGSVDVTARIVLQETTVKVPYFHLVYTRTMNINTGSFSHQAMLTRYLQSTNSSLVLTQNSLQKLKSSFFCLTCFNCAVDVCESYTCLNGGTVTNTAGVCGCDCTDSFTGDTCEGTGRIFPWEQHFPLVPLDSVICIKPMGVYTCIKPMGVYTCTKPMGVYTCTKRIKVKCPQLSSCCMLTQYSTAKAATHLSAFFPFILGFLLFFVLPFLTLIPSILVAVDVCASHSCVNGGTVTNTAGVCGCDCADGFTGDTCEGTSMILL